MAALCALTALLSAAGSPLPPFPAAPRGTPNMNGEYTDSSGATLPHFADYPRPTAYFDAWSPPFSTLYSQVWWTALAPLAIPKAVSDRYANGGVMAIVGVEMDQVRRVDNVSAHDVSVPINMAYNHHWTVTISGSKSTRERVQFGEGDDRSEFDDGHGVPDVVYRHAPLPELAKDCRSGHCAVCPSKQAQSCATKIGLGGGNGGEMRKTWHGLPAGYARPLLEPSHVQVTPMQIDTWNRDAMKLGGGSAFVSGPTPRTCLSPTSGPDALYSGLLECPLTTRITKNIQSDYTAHSAGASGCEHDIMTAAECFSAVPKALGACCGSCGSCSISWLAENKRNLGRQRIVESADAPVGCSMLRGAAVGIDGRGAVDILFNMAKTSETSCGDHAAEVRGTQTYTHAKTGSAPLVNVTISLHPQAQTATITMSGPASVWFGTGFGSSNMKGTYAIVVDGSGKVTERTLGDHTAGALLPPSVSLRSSKVAGASRVVVLRRPMRAADPRGFSFSANSSVLPLIDAVGSTKQFAHHKAKTAASAVLLPVDAPSAQRQVGGACVCAAKPPPFGAGVGTFTYTPNATQKGERGKATTLGFGNQCCENDLSCTHSDLLQHRNPTCDVRAYTGGQSACHHLFSLLDEDQDIPWPDTPITYTHKYRFHYQDWSEGYHAAVSYSGGKDNWDVGAGGKDRKAGAEYDVPKCATGIPGCKMEDGHWVHYVIGTWDAKDMGMASVKPVVVHMHCHAPTCLSMTLYDDDTNATICREDAAYGGNGSSSAYRGKWGERGFIAMPPCIFSAGDKSPPWDRYTPPPELNTTRFRLVKRCNATHGHHGEMAHGQIFYSSA